MSDIDFGEQMAIGIHINAKPNVNLMSRIYNKVQCPETGIDNL